MDSPVAQVMPREPFTVAAVVKGVRIGWPFLLSSGATGMVMGVTYHKLGFDLLQAFLLSATVFSGTAQAVAATMLIATPMPLAAMLLAVFGINARYLIMSAHLRRVFPDISLLRMLPTLFLLVDGAWMITVTKAEKGERDAGFLLGLGLTMYLGWVGGTVLGHLAHVAPTGPLAAAAAFLPLGFITAIIPSQWKGRATILPWLVTAGVALIMLFLIPPTWATLVGAAAGTIVAVAGDRR